MRMWTSEKGRLAEVREQHMSPSPFCGENVRRLDVGLARVAASRISSFHLGAAPLCTRPQVVERRQLDPIGVGLCLTLP
jgi:hypothetical protein